MNAPHSLEDVLHHLYKVRDAMAEHKPIEVVRRLEECTAAVQNELDWTYGTDIELKYILDYLLILQDRYSADPDNYIPLVDNLDSLLRTVQAHNQNRARHNAPERYDTFELEARRTRN